MRPAGGAPRSRCLTLHVSSDVVSRPFGHTNHTNLDVFVLLPRRSPACNGYIFISDQSCKPQEATGYSYLDLRQQCICIMTNVEEHILLHARPSLRLSKSRRQGLQDHRYAVASVTASLALCLLTTQQDSLRHQGARRQEVLQACHFVSDISVRKPARAACAKSYKYQAGRT